MNPLIVALAMFSLSGAPPGQEGDSTRIDSLIRRLQSPAIEERDGASAELKKLDGAALPRLRAALQGADAEVRSRLTDVLAVIEVSQSLTPGLRNAAPDLAERLSKGPPHLWTETFFRLVGTPGVGKADLDCVVPRALRGARAGAEQVKVCDLLAERPLPSAVPILLDFLASDLDTVSDAATAALLASGSGEAGARAAALATHARPRVRRNAGRLLRDADLLTPLLTDPASEVRRAAAAAMAVLDKPRAVRALGKGLEHPDPAFRGDAAASLGEMGAAEAVAAILRVLGDPQPQVRAEALKALVRLEARHAGAGIEPLVEDPDYHVRLCALQAVQTLGLAEACPRLARLLREAKGRDRTELGMAADALARLKGRECLPFLKEILETGASEGRLEAIRLVRRLSADELAPELTALLRDPEVSVAWASAVTLGDLRAGASVPQVRRLLASPHPTLRGAAASVLAQLDARKDADALVALLQDPDGDVRVRAALALAQFGRDDGLAIAAADDGGTFMGSRFSLCALRSPKAWREAEAVRGGTAVPERAGDLAQQLAQSIGAAVEVSRPRTPEQAEWLRGTLVLNNRGGRKSVRDLLQDLVRDSEYDLILEEGKVRLLHRDDARREWNAWWKASRGK